MRANVLKAKRGLLTRAAEVLIVAIDGFKSHECFVIKIDAEGMESGVIRAPQTRFGFWRQ